MTTERTARWALLVAVISAAAAVASVVIAADVVAGPNVAITSGAATAGRYFDTDEGLMNTKSFDTLRGSVTLANDGDESTELISVGWHVDDTVDTEAELLQDAALLVAPVGVTDGDVITAVDSGSRDPLMLLRDTALPPGASADLEIFLVVADNEPAIEPNIPPTIVTMRFSNGKVLEYRLAPPR